MALHASAIRQVPVPTLRQELPTVLAEPGIAGETAYIHVDLDVLDPSERLMNQFSARAGLGMPDLEWAIATIAEGTRVGASSLTAFDPVSDATGRPAGPSPPVAVALTDAVNRLEKNRFHHQRFFAAISREAAAVPDVGLIQRFANFLT